jgi:hypothetical protein
VESQSPQDEEVGDGEVGDEDANVEDNTPRAPEHGRRSGHQGDGYDNDNEV